MVGNNFRIFKADLTPSGWDVKYHPVNSSNANWLEASMSTNAEENIMVFTRWQADPYIAGDVYYSVKNSNDVWEGPPIMILKMAEVFQF
ncbi:MAG: hypothetical protein IPM57_06625 [Oligoflexia bacterium]|nr:hypothetical protein [Oligoflexia bacterium]